MVGALPLDASEAEPLRGEPTGEPVARRAPGAAQLLVSVKVEAELGPVRIQVERGEAERREVSCIVDLDHCSRRPMDELNGQQEVLAGSLERREIALEPRIDPGEHLERGGHGLGERRVPPGLRNALEPDVALFAQPVERGAAEDNPVLRRRVRERRMDVAGNHEAIVAPKRGQPLGWR